MKQLCVKNPNFVQPPPLPIKVPPERNHAFAIAGNKYVG